MSTDSQLATQRQHPVIAAIQEKLPDVRLALPPNTIGAERLEVAFRSAFNKNPKLLECSRMSICASLVNCATLGLIPNTPEQHAYLIPRKGECNLEIGYRGFVYLMTRGGVVSHVDSGVVYKGDTYEFQKGDPVVCWVRPNLEMENRESSPIIAAYCLVVFVNGEKRLEVMDGADLAKIERAMMRQNFDKASPAWKEWRSEMLRKAPIKRIAKTMPLGPLVAKAAELDNAAFRNLPAAPPKKIVLANGETLPTLPRHQIEPADQDGGAEISADEADPENYAAGKDLF